MDNQYNLRLFVHMKQILLWKITLPHHMSPYVTFWLLCRSRLGGSPIPRIGVSKGARRSGVSTGDELATLREQAMNQATRHAKFEQVGACGGEHDGHEPVQGPTLLEHELRNAKETTRDNDEVDGSETLIAARALHAALDRVK